MSWFKSTNKAAGPGDRSTERVDWSPEASLNVQVVTRKGEVIDVRWVDLSVTGVKLVVPRELKDEMRQGYPIKMAFEDDGVAFRVNGRIIWAASDLGLEVENLGVRFAYVNPDLGDKHPELWEYFNRRMAFRVTAPLDEPVEVEIEGAEDSLMSTMIDISATGISMLLPKEAGKLQWVDEALGCKFNLNLQLSVNHHTMRLLARTERVELRAKGIFWGMSFLEEDERELGEELEQIADYVMARQRQMRGVEEE